MRCQHVLLLTLLSLLSLTLQIQEEHRGGVQHSSAQRALGRGALAYMWVEAAWCGACRLAEVGPVQRPTLLMSLVLMEVGAAGCAALREEPLSCTQWAAVLIEVGAEQHGECRGVLLGMSCSGVPWGCDGGDKGLSQI